MTDPKQPGPGPAPIYAPLSDHEREVMWFDMDRFNYHHTGLHLGQDGK